MNAQELVVQFRRRADDIAVPPLWTDDEILSYFNLAQDEACIRARLLEDDSTPEVVEIAGTAGEARYALHPKIIQVRTARWAGKLLTGIAPETLDDRFSQGTDWRTLEGDPQWFLDPQQVYLHLVRRPTRDAAIKLSVYRRALVAIALEVPANPDADPPTVLVPATSPEIPEKYHPLLVDWALRLAYLRRDSDTQDEKKALMHEGMFTASFGPRPSADVNRRQLDRRKKHTTFNPDW